MGTVSIGGQESPSKPIEEIITDSLEAIIDSNLPDTFIKEIPFLGTVAKSIQAFNSIRDHLFFKKVKSFLDNLDEFTENQKEEFWERHNNDEKARGQLGEQIIIYLERFDHEKKAALLAKAFGAYITGNINYGEFMDLAILIDSIKIHYLIEILIILAHSRLNSFHRLGLPTYLNIHVPYCEKAGLLQSKSEIIVKKDYNSLDDKKLLYLNEVEYCSTIMASHFLHYVIKDSLDGECQKVDEDFEFGIKLNRDSFNSDLEWERSQNERRQRHQSK
ncbi:MULTISPECIES: hypothetical protein [Larkinella]|jgi:hypothetical protein|uniref:Uncharacterized protein n=1 Tax=Larkinella humicola TaxID=2607654 RepID=A0A5N1JL43_9BACT|nr:MULTISPECIES: hypothetical protein [Larkinella]KAA9356894.1 hypothetical protein F0P93_03900 [Larkinella humicola]